MINAHVEGATGFTQQNLDLLLLSKLSQIWGEFSRSKSLSLSKEGINIWFTYGNLVQLLRNSFRLKCPFMVHSLSLRFLNNIFSVCLWSSGFKSTYWLSYLSSSNCACCKSSCSSSNQPYPYAWVTESYDTLEWYRPKIPFSVLIMINCGKFGDLEHIFKLHSTLAESL